MCGFIGIIHDLQNEKQSQYNFKSLTNMITHRGPDEDGIYEDDHVQFGFRRLSIIDLENGTQPLSFENERYWIIFNGEIYNYIELREQLISEGIKFQTSSDTEVLLALFSSKKYEMVKYLRGMFAFVIWDKQEKQIYAARDPFGIKPFFYYVGEKILFCASEKKSILDAFDSNKVNERSLQHYLTYQFPPEPETMSEGIMKLEPGHYFTKKIGQPIQIKQYWKTTFNPTITNLTDAKKQIIDVLRDSVKIHMRSDVPVGSFLSGGIDSTAIVALAKEFNPKLKTFTVGFENIGYNEISVAEQTAEKLKVEHYTNTITPEQFINEFPKIIWHMDDPVADPSVVPLYFLAKEARKQVKVVLSGEGADELFGGYNIYREPMSLQGFERIPSGGKAFLRKIAALLPEGVKGKSFIERGSMTIEQRYIGNAKIFTELEKAILMKNYDQNVHYTDITKRFYADSQSYDNITKMQNIDIHTWLRGDILVKADKMTMANSLELRVPFLDKEVFNVAATIDSSLKVTKQTTKLALREAMASVVPSHVLNRRKLGFPVPIRVWLKDTLYDWAKNLITESATDDLFDKQYLIKLLDDHAHGKADNSRKLWTVFTFMIWHQIFVEKIYGDRFEKEVVEGLKQESTNNAINQ